jgi:hypothetical protein
MLAEVDNWDLSVHRREATRVQNRWNVQVGFLENQPTPRTGKDGFLYHARLSHPSSSGIRDRDKRLSEIVVTEGGDSPPSWTQLAPEVWQGSLKHELCREGVHIGPP